MKLKKSAFLLIIVFSVNLSTYSSYGRFAQGGEKDNLGLRVQNSEGDGCEEDEEDHSE